MTAHPHHTHHHENAAGLQPCAQILTQLNDYADHALAVELCADLEAHLAQCENCQIILDTLRKTIYLVHRLPDSEQALPQDVEQRLFATLNLEEYLTA